MSDHDFTALTERPGLAASREQLARLFHRYRFTRDLAEGRDVLDTGLPAVSFGMVLLFEALCDRPMRSGSPTRQNGLSDRLISLAKRLAVACHLIPGSLAARNRLKRLVFGPLTPIPNVIPENLAPYELPTRIANDDPAPQWKILYAVGRA